MTKPNKPPLSQEAIAVPQGVKLQPRKRTGKPTLWYIYPTRDKGVPNVAVIQSEDRPQLTREILERIEEFRRLKNDAERADMDPRDKGTPLKWLINRWRSDPIWEQLREATKRTWGYELDRIAKRWGNVPLILFYDDRTVTKVYEWRDSRRKTPKAADTGIIVLRQLLSFGSPLVGSSVEITRNIPKLHKPQQRADIVWTDNEIERFINVAHAKGKPELAYVIRLAALTGMRRGDLTTVCKAHVRENMIIKRARKEIRGRSGLIALPTFSRLAALILELNKLPRQKGVRRLLVDKSGSKWDDNRLTSEFIKIRDLAGIKHVERSAGNRKPKIIMKTLHDVRGTFATKLMTEAHLNDAEVARVMGWEERKVHNIRRAYVAEPARMQGLAARMRRSVRS